jgi:three-Cys-motif partner protein
MAVGTSGGLLDSPKATSVFKHAILRQYVTPFIAKVGSSAPGGRVMLVDGFAGRGRFDDGNPGSAELFMRAAAGLPGVKTSIRLFERKKSDADRLSAVAAEYAAKGLDVTAERADIASRLEATVTSAEGIPLFLFLDPCGQNVPFELLVNVLGAAREKKWPPTEALLNLSAEFTRRISGALNKGHDDALGIEPMNTMMGGTWWQQLALDEHARTADGTWGRAADAVAFQYLRNLSDAAKMDGVLVPVRRKPENQPTYHLAYLTRSPDGLWVMADALARARQEWLREVGPQDDDPDGTLFAIDPVTDLIDVEQNSAKTRARARVLEVASRAKSFTLIPNVREVYGDDYGTLTESNLGKVVDELKQQGLLTREPGKPLGKATFGAVERDP